MFTHHPEEEQNAVLAANVDSTTKSDKLIKPQFGTSRPSLIQALSHLHSSHGNRVIQRMLNRASSQKSALPTKLKIGIETLSNLAMNDVTVHYNSDKPAQVGALAFAQGTDIHLAPGQERHLPHEAWHVVQQMQGRVKPTLRAKGASINDDAALEHEADMMGAKALQNKSDKLDRAPLPQHAENKVVQRRKVGKFGIEAEAGDGFFQISAPKNSDGANLIQDEGVSFEEYKLADLDGHVSVTLDGEINRENDTHYYRNYTVEFVQRPVDVELENAHGLNAVANAWEHALAFWQAHIGITQALKTRLGDWYNLQQIWRGEQFEDRAKTPGITHEEEEEAQFDWTNRSYFTGIVTREEDPEVSMQMTAGSTLLGLLEVYLETVAILSGGARAQGGDREMIATFRRNSEERPETAKLTNFRFLISQYIKGNSNTRDERRRPYAKEYVTLMSRTSLDLVYQQLNAPAKRLFETEVAAYLFNKEPNPLMGSFERPANARVFVKDAVKEDVTAITIEQLLLSVIKKKRAEIGEALVDDEAAAVGDVLVQNNLAGLGEINPNAPDMLAKFGLNNAGEMMQGIPGMIFENRGAKPHKLSAMPDLFRMLAASLHQVNVAHEQALQEQELARVRVQRPAQAPEKTGGCYLTTACVTQRGLPDDCEELQVLRTFRDKVLAPLPVGPDLIACYYQHAPGIVMAIDAHTDRHVIYDRIYEIVRFCVDAIKGGYQAVALAAYCEMTLGLERAFGSGERRL